jgi:hypothetical protein
LGGENETKAKGKLKGTKSRLQEGDLLVAVGQMVWLGEEGADSTNRGDTAFLVATGNWQGA